MTTNNNKTNIPQDRQNIKVYGLLQFMFRLIRNLVIGEILYTSEKFKGQKINQANLAKMLNISRPRATQLKNLFLKNLQVEKGGEER